MNFGGANALSMVYETLERIVFLHDVQAIIFQSNMFMDRETMSYHICSNTTFQEVWIILANGFLDRSTFGNLE
jgi:hypothetical protein